MLGIFLSACTAAVIVSIVFGQALAGEPRAGGRNGWLIALLLIPGWMGFRVGSANVSPLSFAALCGVVTLFAFPQPHVSGGWRRSGMLMILYVGSMAFSEYQAGELRPMVLPGLVLNYLVPYYLGLTFLDRRADLRASSMVLARCVAAIAVYACLESVTRINVLAKLTTVEHWTAAGDGGYRYGMRRATGMTTHPISFGLAMVLSLPWLLVARKSEVDGPRPWWHRNLMPAAIAATFASLSRSPILGFGLALAVVGIFRSRRYRYPLAALLIVGALGLTFAQEMILDNLVAITGNVDERPVYVMVDGRPELYDGTRHRILLPRVYRQVIEDAGWTGFGYNLTSVSLKKYNIPDVFWSVDGHFVLYRMQYGLLGILLQMALIVNAMVIYARLAVRASEPIALFSAAAVGSFVVILNLMWGSSIDYYFNAILFFYVGLGENLREIERIEPPEPESIYV